MKLESSINFIKTSENGFVMEKNYRYIDLENLNKYTVKQLKEIAYSFNYFLHRGRKIDYINGILKNKDLILKENKIALRNKNLKELLG